MIRGHLPTYVLRVWVLYNIQSGQVARKVGKVARNEIKSGQRFYAILPEFRVLLVLFVRFM